MVVGALGPISKLAYVGGTTGGPTALAPTMAFGPVVKNGPSGRDFQGEALTNETACLLSA